MPGLLLTWRPDIACYDLFLRTGTTQAGAAGTDFVGDDGFLSAMVVSLFTDRRASDDDPLPDDSIGHIPDLRGWWGDDLSQGEEVEIIGSRLWLLSREKDLDEVLSRARNYTEEALAWMKTDKAGRLKVDRLEVAVSRVQKGYLGISVAATRTAESSPSVRKTWNFLYDYKQGFVASPFPQGG